MSLVCQCCAMPQLARSGDALLCGSAQCNGAEAPPPLRAKGVTPRRIESKLQAPSLASDASLPAARVPKAWSTFATGALSERARVVQGVAEHILHWYCSRSWSGPYLVLQLLQLVRRPCLASQQRSKAFLSSEASGLDIG